MEEKYFDVLLSLLGEDFIPLREGVVIAESLSVLTIQLFDHSRFLPLRPVEITNSAHGFADSRPHLDHFRAGVLFRRDGFFRLLTSLGLTLVEPVYSNDGGRNSYRQPQRQGRHQSLSRRVGDPEAGRQLVVSGR